MNAIRLLSMSLILAGTAGAALAQEPATRAQVKAELAQAIRDGDVQVGDSGRTLREEDPARYPKPVEAPGETRAQVKAELAQAIRDGDIPQGDSGVTPAQQFPQRYAAARCTTAKPASR